MTAPRRHAVVIEDDPQIRRFLRTVPLTEIGVGYRLAAD